jgi:eukaryotic-like serine/threonine-protein kinase
MRSMRGLILPEVMASRYRLDEWLGTGGMAEVFVATDLVLGRLVAVKRMPASAIADETARARFAREARALARVNHPNVVTVFDAIEDEGRPFLVMELVDGITLRDALDGNTGLPPSRAIAIAAEIAAGLAAVHAQGIVHRDLKPSNVFITTSGTVKIGDFGIARIASDPALTRTGEMFGSAPYVAPEQVRGDAVDDRADLYALGCVMFEMLSGRPPFEGDDAMSLTYHHVHTEPPRLETLMPGMPGALGSIVHQLLAKDPEDRPRTAEDVGMALVSVPDIAPDIRPDGRGDVATVEVATTERVPRTVTAVLPPARAGDEPAQRTFAPWIPWAVLAALGLTALLVLNAVTGWNFGAATQQRSSSRESASSRPSPVSSASPSTSPAAATLPPVFSSSDAALGLVTLVREMESAGAVDDHLAKDLEHGADDVVKDLDHGDVDKAFEDIGRMRDGLASAVDRGEVSPEDGQTLQAAIDRLESTVEQTGSSGDGDHQDGGDEGD